MEKLRKNNDIKKNNTFCNICISSGIERFKPAKLFFRGHCFLHKLGKMVFAAFLLEITEDFKRKNSSTQLTFCSTEKRINRLRRRGHGNYIFHFKEKGKRVNKINVIFSLNRSQQTSNHSLFLLVSVIHYFEST